MVKAIYAGSFDPLTNGHLDIIKRSKKFSDHLVIAIGNNPAKKTLFTEQERLIHLWTAIDQSPALSSDSVFRISAASFSGLLVEFARQANATLLIRGIRSATDFEYETTLANVNKMLAPEIETVFLPTDPTLSVVSSSAVKEIARNGGSFQTMVPSFIAEAVREKLKL